MRGRKNGAPLRIKAFIRGVLRKISRPGTDMTVPRLRILADDMRHELSHQIMLKIADEYELVAQRAQERATGLANSGICCAGVYLPICLHKKGQWKCSPVLLHYQRGLLFPLIEVLAISIQCPINGVPRLVVPDSGKPDCHSRRPRTIRCAL
jgi:hypothetical protein